LEKEDLQIIIDELEASNSKEDAYFGIFNVSGQDECFINANKQGLELFAADLLKASLRAEDLLAQNPKSVFPLSYDEDWMDEESDILIQYVEPSIEERKKTKAEPYKETPKDIVIKVGCVVGLVVTVVSSIIGFITLLSWLF
jgi:hypothetical protein